MNGIGEVTKGASGSSHSFIFKDGRVIQKY